MVEALSKQVLKSFSGLIQLFALILGDTSDSSPNVIGLSNGKNTS
jgi:hypothetical protein